MHAEVSNLYLSCSGLDNALSAGHELAAISPQKVAIVGTTVTYLLDLAELLTLYYEQWGRLFAVF